MTKLQFTVESPGAAEKAGEGKPRRAALLGNQDLINLPPGVNSLHDNFLVGVKISGDGPFLGRREITAAGAAGAYVWESYNVVYKRVKNLGSGFSGILGLKRQEPVGLFSINRAEWVIAEQACYMHALTTVPLYDTLGAEAIEYILTQTEMRVVVATADKVAALIKLKPKLPQLDTIIIMDAYTEQATADAKAVGITILGFTQLEQQGAEKATEPAGQSTPEDTATICYTSGTTGLPKGVILTHRNILSAANAVAFSSTKNRFSLVSKDDIHISYLPLAHVFERVIQQFLIMHGASIGFYQGDTLKLLDDVAELKPTFFVSVPRLFNRIYDKVLAGVKAKGGLSQFLFNTAFSQKKAALAKGSITHFLWDRLVFSNVRARLGGRVRFLLSGSAPISAEVMDFLKICFAVDVYEGYGQTETSAGISLTVMGDYTSGHIGVPFPCCEVKLVDVPSMNYTSKDTPYPRGEICVRGNQVFKGYFKLPDKTAEAIDADGWCHTGDVGQWDADGRLVIIDRVKQIFKLAQGEYIAPEKIEAVYTQHELIAQAFVHGDSLQSCLVGIIVPDPDMFCSWAKKQGVEGTLAEQCADAKINKALLAALVAHGKSVGLKGFENVRAIHIDHEPFSIENNLLTPTFKLKRHDAKKKYQSQIDAMYATLGSA